MWSARDILIGTSKFLYVRSEGAGGGKVKGEGIWSPRRTGENSPKSAYKTSYPGMRSRLRINVRTNHSLKSYTFFH